MAPKSFSAIDIIEQGTAFRMLNSDQTYVTGVLDASTGMVHIGRSSLLSDAIHWTTKDVKTIGPFSRTATISAELPGGELVTLQLHADKSVALMAPVGTSPAVPCYMDIIESLPDTIKITTVANPQFCLTIPKPSDGTIEFDSPMSVECGLYRLEPADAPEREPVQQTCATKSLTLLVQLVGIVLLALIAFQLYSPVHPLLLVLLVVLMAATVTFAALKAPDAMPASIATMVAACVAIVLTLAAGRLGNVR